MRTPRFDARGSLDFNMTPMIDVTFQLIIFFLVSNNMAQQEAQVELNLPTAASGEETPADASRRVVVNVAADGALVVAGETLALETFGLRLAAERRESESLEVRIRCDRQAAFGRVKPILRRCLSDDVRKVTLAVVKPGEP